MIDRGMSSRGLMDSSPKAVELSKPTRLKIATTTPSPSFGSARPTEMKLRRVRGRVMTKDDETEHQDEEEEKASQAQHDEGRDLGCPCRPAGS